MCSKCWVDLLKNIFPIDIYKLLLSSQILVTNPHSLMFVGTGHSRKRKLEEMDDFAIEPPAKMNHP